MSLAEKLQYLFSHHNPRGQTPPSLEYVSEQISSQGGTKVSVGMLSELRSGKLTNPTIDKLSAIARFFGVDTSYFTDDRRTEEINAQLRLLNAIENAQVRRIALKAGTMTPDALDALATLIEGYGPVEDGTDKP